MVTLHLQDSKLGIEGTKKFAISDNAGICNEHMVYFQHFTCGTQFDFRFRKFNMRETP
jgi:hypothetical protein